MWSSVTEGPLFIVDNSEGGRNGLDYLREWSELASRIDIATGYFEIGSLLDLDGHWQKFDKIRILMGDEVTRRTKKAMLLAVKQRAEAHLDDSIEDDQERDPFLTGIDAIVAALASGQIECRVYNKDSSTRRRTSPTDASTSSDPRRWSGRATSLGRV